MKTTNAVVREVLARHLDRDASTIEGWQHLELDLYLSPSDLAVVLREIGDVEDVDLRTESAAALSTVGELLQHVCRVLAREKRADSLDRVAWVTGVEGA